MLTIFITVLPKWTLTPTFITKWDVFISTFLALLGVQNSFKLKDLSVDLWENWGKMLWYVIFKDLKSASFTKYSFYLPFFCNPSTYQLLCDFWSKTVSKQKFVRKNFDLQQDSNPGPLGPIHLLNTRKYCGNTCKYWDNTYKYWANTWKKCSPASVILTSIATILVSFKAILKSISVNFKIRSQFQSNFPTISFEIDQNNFKTYK